MESGRRRRVRVLIACPDDLRDLRAQLLEIAGPQLGRMLDRRGVDLLLDALELPDPDPGTGLAAALRELGEPDTVLLCVLGSTPGAPVAPLPAEVENEFPHLVPYEGAGRLELFGRHALAAPDVRSPVFALVTQPGTGLGPLRRSVRQSADRVVLDEDPALPVAELGREVVSALWQAVIDREPELPEVEPEPGRELDENVQFTVYRPRTVRPAIWYDLLAFAHLAERRPDAPADEADPLAQVRRQAAQFLGPRLADFDDARSDARQGIPRDGTLTFLPQVPGVEFNPERRLFRWQEDVHREEFRLRADPALTGRTARGRLSVYLGAIVVAELDLAFRVDQAAPPAKALVDEPAEHARTYRKIFASYSHRDAEIVRQFELLATSLGDEYLRDVIRLRSGEDWDAELHRLIDEADVFQLFWSSNSMRSEQVRREWEYALSLGRAQFVRPTYWEDPLPSVTVPELPPESLRRLHFHRIADVPVAGSVRPLGAVAAPVATLAPPSPAGRVPSPAAYPAPAARSAVPGPPPAWPAAAGPPPAAAGSAPPAGSALPAPAARRRRLTPLLLPLAGVVVVGVVAGSVLTGIRDRPSGSAAPPGDEPTPPAATSAPTATTDPSAPPTSSTAADTARVATMAVTGASRISGPVLSRPGRIGTVYAVQTGDEITITVELVNPEPIATTLTVRSGLACFDADGQEIDPEAPSASVRVPGDTAASPGVEPVARWRGEPVRIPSTCRPNPGSGEADGLIWVQSSVGSGGGGTVISAAFRLG